jgi:hypothetical protein
MSSPVLCRSPCSFSRPCPLRPSVSATRFLTVGVCVNCSNSLHIHRPLSFGCILPRSTRPHESWSPYLRPHQVLPPGVIARATHPGSCLITACTCVTEGGCQHVDLLLRLTTLWLLSSIPWSPVLVGSDDYIVYHWMQVCPSRCTGTATFARDAQADRHWTKIICVVVRPSSIKAD